MPELADIPYGSYCYEMLEYQPETFSWKVRYCPYYQFPLKEDGYAVCLLTKDTNDLCLDDQCKTCGINE